MLESVPAPLDARKLLPAEIAGPAALKMLQVLDCVKPNLHWQSWATAGTRSTLTLAAFVLAAPTVVPGSFPGAQTPQEVALWERSALTLVRGELAAALDSVPLGQPAPRDVLASLSAVMAWSIHRGAAMLATQCLNLMRNIVGSEPSDAETWQAQAIRELGRDVFSSAELPLETIRKLRDVWIRYNERLRLRWNIADWIAIGHDWSRGPELGPDPNEYLRNLHPAPMPRIWEASMDPNFDPRTVPNFPLVLDVAGFSYLSPGSAQRQAALAEMGRFSVEARLGIDCVHAVLRYRTDTFLKAVTDAGLKSPGELPSGPIGTDETNPDIARLLIERHAIEMAISECVAAYPPVIREAVLHGSCLPIVDCCDHFAGSRLHGYRRAPAFFAIPLILLELRTSLGIILSGPSAEVPPGTLEALADEFVKPELCPLLEIPVLFARFLAEWNSMIRPEFLYAAHKRMPVIFKAFCHHLGFLRRFKRAGAAPDMIAAVDWDARTCLETMRLHSARENNLSRTLYKVADAMYRDEAADSLEVERAKGSLDGDLAVGDELVKLKGVLDVYADRSYLA